jgi:hypothetical protein
VLLVEEELVIRGVLTSERVVLIGSELAVEGELTAEGARSSERAVLVRSS